MKETIQFTVFSVHIFINRDKACYDRRMHVEWLMTWSWSATEGITLLSLGHFELFCQTELFLLNERVNMAIFHFSFCIILTMLMPNLCVCHKDFEGSAATTEGWLLW